ncbi:MAG: hypothetical protein KJO32_14915 [Deltaproteobacteria bacterium]|nr:hypothetical protein [Deltaproteobacteria bacterium]
MDKVTIDIIINHWQFCSVTKQRALIDRYLDKRDRVLTQAEWLGFLADEFGIDVHGNLSRRPDEIYN